MLFINIRPYHPKLDLQTHKCHFNSQTEYTPKLPVSSAKAIIIGVTYDRWFI